MLQKSNYVTVCFVTVRERNAVTFTTKEKPNAGVSLTVSTVLRPPLEEPVQCMTQLNAFYCTQASLKHRESLTKTD